MRTIDSERERFVPKNRRWHFVLLLSLLLTSLGLFGWSSTPQYEWLAVCLLGFFAPGVPVALIQLFKPKGRIDESNGLVVRRSAWSAICYLIVCSSWFMVSLRLGSEIPGLMPVANVLILLTAVGIAVAFWQCFDNRPVLVVNEEGYYDRNLSARPIPWSQIAGAEIVNLDGKDVIALKIREIEIKAEKASLSDNIRELLDGALGAELSRLGIVELSDEHIDQAFDYILARCEDSEPEVGLDKLLERI